MGFFEYPFSKWSAEQERDRQSDLFIRPTYYGPIDENFRNGSGMFLVGERGTGKTAAIYDLISRAVHSNLVTNIDDFSSVNTTYEPKELYFLIISNVADKIFSRIFNKRKLLRKLKSSERLLLSYVYQEFTTPTTKSELTRRLEEIQAPFVKRWAFKIFSILRLPVNLALNTVVHAGSEALARAIGTASGQVSEYQVREFFPDIPFRSDSSFNSLRASLNLLERMATLVKNLGLGRTIVVLDKLDEDARLEGDADRIAGFVKGVITQTNLHLSQNVQLVASIWSVPFNMLLKQENVRTQKMNVESLSWDRSDLERALNTRLKVFSNGKIVNLSEILESHIPVQDVDLMYYLANNNPRDMWHVMDAAMRQQFKIDPFSTKISIIAVQDGLKAFVKTFNYYEYYPRRANARANSMDVYAYIRHLLRLSSPEFTRNQLTERSGVSGASVNNYVSAMENMGLISSKGQTGGNVNYVIRDPKIRFALEHHLDVALEAR